MNENKISELLNEINNIETTLKNIRYCELIVEKYKCISSNAMNVFDKNNNYEKDVDIDPLLVYKTINNNNNLLINNEYFKIHIHDIYCDMINKYINNQYYKTLDEEYISTEAKIYKIYIFKITAEKKLNTFKSIDILNKELESLLKRYIILVN